MLPSLHNWLIITVHSRLEVLTFGLFLELPPCHSPSGNPNRFPLQENPKTTTGARKPVENPCGTPPGPPLRAAGLTKFCQNFPQGVR
ncbi:MAG: hypothetical protein KME26_17875 [Oscillatoria princeps RMCB-10]|nr:hypothetical protein [Oscillatoria princeps RMCB-10]